MIMNKPGIRRLEKEHNSHHKGQISYNMLANEYFPIPTKIGNNNVEMSEMGQHVHGTYWYPNRHLMPISHYLRDQTYLARGTVGWTDSTAVRIPSLSFLFII